MSVAFELDPVQFPVVPEPERPDAQVLHLYPPSERSVAAPLRLTRRGRVVLGVAVAALCAGVVLLAWHSAPSPAQPAKPAPAAVTVHSGDTLWSIAARVAPDRDPRAEVVQLRRLNNLTSAELAVGQVLRTR